MVAVIWFRRDLRLSDHPALSEACADPEVLPLFVVDPALWRPAGLPRRCYLAASLRSLDTALQARGGRLHVVEGDPVRRVVEAATAAGADRVHVSADFGPYGARRDARVEAALREAGIGLVRTGSPYAVSPGRVRTGSGSAYRVFTPFARAWAEHGWLAPVMAPVMGPVMGPVAGPVTGPTTGAWLERTLSGSVPVPETPIPDGLTLPEAGEAAARRRWNEFLADGLDTYQVTRDRPDVDGTSRMSVHLKWGEIHPRTLLADVDRLRSPGAATFRKELAWREFYADVLHHRPDSAREYLKPELARLQYDEPGAAFEAWRRGRTGYPIVDAGMRQLRGAGWVHNRVRMIVASFLVKDLHVEWQHGARHFMEWLVDGDLASNQHGWQWVAGSGTDPSPFFRVFNPTTQGRRFDPDGTYVRRWVPELTDASDPHDPGPETRRRTGYPAPVVDHGEERRAALARWERIRR